MGGGQAGGEGMTHQEGLGLSCSDHSLVSLLLKCHSTPY